LTAFAGAGWVTNLDHEAFDVPVKQAIIVVI